ncbi:MAG: hypothetical protein IJ329_03740 [Clostridia bacterium]|nr:hypothetical protein [Clostridia bacterium]
MLSEWFYCLYIWAFFANVTLLVLFITVTVLLTFAAIVSYRLKSASVFFALIAIVLGGVLLTFARYQISVWQTAPFFALLLITVGALYLSFFLCVRVWKHVQSKKKEREIQARQMRYTLPQKDNTFIRARLNTVLQEESPIEETENGEEIKLRFVYARKLLAKLRETALSTAERLETDELVKIFDLYRQKERFISEDVRLISEAFSRVLKLAAKYGV